MILLIEAIMHSRWCSSSRYCCPIIRHFEVNIENESLAFTWKMRPGSRDVKEYGIKLAECSGFPAQVTSRPRNPRTTTSSHLILR